MPSSHPINPPLASRRRRIEKRKKNSSLAKRPSASPLTLHNKGDTEATTAVEMNHFVFESPISQASKPDPQTPSAPNPPPCRRNQIPSRRQLVTSEPVLK